VRGGARVDVPSPGHFIVVRGAERRTAWRFFDQLNEHGCRKHVYAAVAGLFGGHPFSTRVWSDRSSRPQSCRASRGNLTTGNRTNHFHVPAGSTEGRGRRTDAGASFTRMSGRTKSSMRRSQRALLAATVGIAVLSACAKAAHRTAGARAAWRSTSLRRSARISPPTSPRRADRAASDSILTLRSRHVVAVLRERGPARARGRGAGETRRLDAAGFARAAAGDGSAERRVAERLDATGTGHRRASQQHDHHAQQQLAAARNGVLTADAAYQSAKSTYVADEALLQRRLRGADRVRSGPGAYVQAEQALNNARETQHQAIVALAAATVAGTNACRIQNQQIAGQSRRPGCGSGASAAAANQIAQDDHRRALRRCGDAAAARTPARSRRRTSRSCACPRSTRCT